jgi:undecaprenyl-diphosphatase
MRCASDCARASLCSSPIALTSCLLLATLGTWHLTCNWDAALARYQPQRASEALDIGAWRQGADLGLPRYRVDLDGERGEPLVLQWLGAPANLAARLQGLGWSRPPAWSWGHAAAFLRPDSPVHALPVLTQLHEGRVPRLVLSLPDRQTPDSRWVLRAWSSGYQDPGDSRPLLLGSLVKQRAIQPANLLSLEIAQPAAPAEVLDLLGPLRTASDAGKVVRGEVADRPATVPNPSMSGAP